MPAFPPQYRAAYLDHERELTIRKTQWGCLLGAAFVPLFWPLDLYFFGESEFKDKVTTFLYLRLACSLFMMAFFRVISSKFGWKHFRLVGLIILFFPAATIAGIVYATDGMASPYYAGLILVMMFLAVLLDWTFWQSVASVLLVWTLYVTACLGSYAAADKRTFVNNLFFLVSTGVVTVISAKFHSDIRGREFVQRCELAEQKAALEKANHEIKEAEMQLVQSEKLASLGRMSAGIIHEINNPLNYALTGLFSLRKKSRHLAVEQQTDYAEILKDVEEGVNRVKTIVSDLRMFTHPSTELLDPVPVAEVVTPALRFLSNEWKDSVQIEQKFADHQTILANKNKLIQVVVNLLQNSLDALKTKKFDDGEKPSIWIEGHVENGHSILSVRDNGSGIDTKDLDKIFDPFFTTKDVGEGMGLGLSICYNIVQESGGKISAKSAPGKFCEFTLEFPIKTHQPVN